MSYPSWSGSREAASHSIDSLQKPYEVVRLSFGVTSLLETRAISAGNKNLPGSARDWHAAVPV